MGAGDTVYEKLSDDPSTAVAIGYSQSKWVTEQLCARANESGILRDQVQVLRIGQLCGDTQEGLWNESEGWPLMIKTAQTTGTLPMIQEVSVKISSCDNGLWELSTFFSESFLAACGRCRQISVCSSIHPFPP
jgi:thioester reductase-like protein